MRTAIYVDGFNFYYRALKGTPYRWVDLHALATQLIKPTNQITLIRYFTARVKPHASKPDQHVRQDAYLTAIQEHIPCLKVHEGLFYSNKTRMPLANPQPGEPKTVEVIKTEEKGSDVNLAVHLVHDALTNAFDVALVISNDSDLAEAIRLARSTGKPVGVANPCADPNRKMTYQLYQAASFIRRIEAKHLKSSQLPDPVGITHKPSKW
ncbi:NYN domain-containing protein [Pseudoxanthomonas winnipegensis]|uniref:NYN domain-containing protein n=2 Tax=Pseudoxanthomonas winnipegensis TaxID=2480810 RepID=A0A4Q8L9T4_9GAMM|nr:NYN domain-containing protein [Pseudoxanthomonas winnipegensis]RZZ82372.1 NYN domain-containing protein [Pseudoxanthomonas winnipegensis]TAA25300.1 NYN domain-containing protein [Pseudoxanthomonas winnipegensis]TBV69472.1 NYN domain-containing protein [Pseudoxanthomonas winnipegensis]